MKKWTALLLALLMTAALFSGCAAPAQPAAEEPAQAEAAAPAAAEAPKQDVNLSFFTGKVETIDLLDEIIAAYNAQSNGITVEQEYQQDASNIIKIKFASDAVPDVMTTYEQEFVDQGKYLALNDMSQWWGPPDSFHEGKLHRSCQRKPVSRMHQYDDGGLLL